MSNELFEAALARLRRGIPLLGLLTVPAQLGCVEPDTGTIENADWAQYQGIRDTTMVSYSGSWWSDCTANTRFGCGSMAVHLKLRVKPVVGANLDWKRVGVVYHAPDDPTERTAVGTYFTTYGDGTEEWHVTATIGAQQILLFDAWYQDGAGGTWVDDNQGELHVVNPGPAYQVVRVEPWLNTATIGPNGVQGQLSVQVSDLDYDKQLELDCTTDGWQTVQRFGIGNAGEKNKWYWTEDFGYGGRERWKIDLDLPGAATRFEYAVGYRHGVVNGAKSYEFWDNNGGTNYNIVSSATKTVLARPALQELPAE